MNGTARWVDPDIERGNHAPRSKSGQGSPPPRRGRAFDGGRGLRYAAGVRANDERARVQLPDRAADRPKAALVLAVALGALGAGVAVAYGLQGGGSGESHASVELQRQARAGGGTDAGTSVLALAGAPRDAGGSGGSGESAEALPSAEAETGVPDAGARAAAIASGRASTGEQAQARAGEAATTINGSTGAGAGPVPEAPEGEPEPKAPAASTGVVAEGTSARASAGSSTATSTSTGASAGGVGAQRVGVGFVDYHVCEGLPQRGGRFPCPRDQKLERQVFGILRGLEDCAALAGQRGEGEIRLTFGRSGVPALRVGGPATQVDPTAVFKCAGHALSRVRTVLRPERMVVRFRFDLR